MSAPEVSPVAIVVTLALEASTGSAAARDRSEALRETAEIFMIGKLEAVYLVFVQEHVRSLRHGQTRFNAPLDFHSLQRPQDYTQR